MVPDPGDERPVLPSRGLARLIHVGEMIIDPSADLLRR
jgi:hypothetical protein